MWVGRKDLRETCPHLKGATCFIPVAIRQLMWLNGSLFLLAPVPHYQVDPNP